MFVPNNNLRSILFSRRSRPNLQTTATTTLPFPTHPTANSIITIKHHYYFILSSLFLWFEGITNCNALTLRHYNYLTPHTLHHYHHHSRLNSPKYPPSWNRFILSTSPPRRHHQQLEDNILVTSLVSPSTFMPMTRPRLLRSRRGTKNIMTESSSSLPAEENDETTTTTTTTNDPSINKTPEDVKSTPEEVKSSIDEAVPEEVKSDDKGESPGGSSPTRKKRATRAKKSTTTGSGGTKRKSVRITNDENNDASSSEEEEERQPTTTTDKKTKAPPRKKRAKKKEPQRLTTKSPPSLPKLWDETKARNDGSYTFKVISWNVAGLRALLKNHPSALPDLVATHRHPDVICLQETKLQDVHVSDPKLALRDVLNEEGYDCYYNCCREKKGYSGTAMFVKRRGGVGKLTVMDGDDDGNTTAAAVTTKTTKGQAKLGQFFKTTTTDKKRQPKEVDKKQPKNNITPDTASSSSSDPFRDDLTPQSIFYSLSPRHDNEGRIMTLTYPHFSLTNLYVPNSGAKLERLSYRTTSWDADLLSFARKKQRQKPIVLLGDLNVAHSSRDVWNDGAVHLPKQAGTTVEERESFGTLLNEGGLVDAFRRLHPDAEGYYTYWSQRAGNRVPNKGLRLDYFVCSESLLSEKEKEEGRVRVRDCYMVDEQMGSDHCPIVLEMEIRKKEMI